MRFEWDPQKNVRNVEKHGIAFEDAAEIVVSAHKVAFESPHKGNDTERFMAIGKLKGKIYTVIYTVRGENVRLISARSARNAEKRKYRAVFIG
jgi:uncharacterized protein